MEVCIKQHYGWVSSRALAIRWQLGLREQPAAKGCVVGEAGIAGIVCKCLAELWRVPVCVWQTVRAAKRM